MLFGLKRRSNEKEANHRARALVDAAEFVHQTATLERLPLLSIAQRDGRAIYWFATNILDVVAVRGRRPDQAQSELLTRDLRDGLVLTDDMAGLKAVSEESLRFIELTVGDKELKRYVKWARTVQ